MKHASKIKRLLNEGRSYSEISNLLKCNKSTISYHAKKMGKIRDTEIDLSKLKINWDSVESDLNNLQIVCPNCHTQTKTYAGKNRINENRKKKKYY